jgi:hypothetical protein
VRIVEQARRAVGSPGIATCAVLVAPGRANYMSFAEFSDPDGNLWLLQERRGQPATPDR